MKIYVTKYALSMGIKVYDAETFNNYTHMVRVGNNYYHCEGKDWHRTIDAAERRAEEMRVKKIASLKKSIVKLEALKWPQP